MRVVEFVGAPGTGKTSLYRGLIEERSNTTLFELRDATYRGIKRDGRKRSVQLLLDALPARMGTKVTDGLVRAGAYSFHAFNRFFLEHNDFVETAVCVVIARMSLLPEPELFLRNLTSLCARYQLAMEGGEDDAILVLDEGFARRAVGLFPFGWGAADDVDVKAYTRFMPRPDLLVLVDAEAQTCKRRLDARGWTSRLRTLSSTERLGFLEASRSTSHMIADELERCGVEVIRVRNDEGDDPRRLIAEAVMSTTS